MARGCRVQTFLSSFQSDALQARPDARGEPRGNLLGFPPSRRRSHPLFDAVFTSRVMSWEFSGVKWIEMVQFTIF